jgi:hypothetical protein
MPMPLLAAVAVCFVILLFAMGKLTADGTRY